jgi:hypothetical protein
VPPNPALANGDRLLSPGGGPRRQVRRLAGLGPLHHLEKLLGLRGSAQGLLLCDVPSQVMLQQ